MFQGVWQTSSIGPESNLNCGVRSPGSANRLILPHVATAAVLKSKRSSARQSTPGAALASLVLPAQSQRPSPKANDRLPKDGVNRLPVMAGIFEHLMEKPGAGSWHPRANQWT